MRRVVILSATVAGEEKEDGESRKGTGRLDTCNKGANKQERGKAKLWEVFVT